MSQRNNGKLLATAGHVTFDTIVKPSSGVLLDHSQGKVVSSPGGTSLLVGCNAASRGVPTRFYGTAGTDAVGDQCLRALVDHGVEPHVVRHGSTAAVVAVIDSQGERRMVVDPGDAFELRVEDICAWEFHDVGVLHLESWYLFDDRTVPVWLEVAGRAKRSGAQLSVDVCAAGPISTGGVRRYLDLLQLLQPDVLFANETEAHLLGLSKSLPRGVGEVVVHRGSEPTLLITEEHRLEIPVRRVVDIVDTAGAGDAVAAGVLAAKMQGFDSAAAIRVGHQMAAEVLGQRGGLLPVKAIRHEVEL